MDGLIISTDDSWASTDIFHSNCRGIWVAIMKDEVDPPEITGIPETLRSPYGGSVRDLRQPPRTDKRQ
jgi:hypothetical protein